MTKSRNFHLFKAVIIKDVIQRQQKPQSYSVTLSLRFRLPVTCELDALLIRVLPESRDDPPVNLIRGTNTSFIGEDFELTPFLQLRKKTTNIYTTKCRDSMLFYFLKSREGKQQ